MYSLQRKSSESKKTSRDNNYSPLVIYPKLTINKPNDKYEQEADAMAQRVMAMPEEGIQRKCAECENEEKGMLQRQGNEEEESLQTKPNIQKMEEEEEPAQAKFDGIQRQENEEEEMVQTKSNSGGMQAPPQLQNKIHASKGGGSPLPKVTNRFMSQAFDTDFSHVRVHTNNQANQMNKSIQAKAFTHGSDIYMRNGEYNPNSSSGKQLLAHELTHVVQQSNGALRHKQSKQLMRKFKYAGIQLMKKGFESTINICHRVLKSRKFKIQNGGLRVVISPKELDKNIPGCIDFNYYVTLTNTDGWIDSDISTCKTITGKVSSFSFANVPYGNYYLTIWRNYDNRYCCLEGDIMVYDEKVSHNSSECKVREYPSLIDMIQGALDIAGFIPALGAIPDGLNALIHAARGDWTAAGISAVAMIPAFGDGAKLVYKGGKELVEASGKTVVKMGEEALTANLKAVKAEAKAAQTAKATPGLGEEMIKAEKRCGLSVDIASQAHKQKTKYRAGTGKVAESAHMVPTVAVKKVHGYSRSNALTILFPRGTHRAFDKHWMDWSRKKVKELRAKGLPEQVTVAEWEAALNRAIQSVPELAGRTGDTMSFMIRTEFYQNLKLKPGDLLPLPKFK